MKRALLVFPGRGSYGAPELGTLARTAASSRAGRAAVEEIAAAIDGPRRARGLPSVLELDAAPKLDPAVHLAGEHASALIVACGLVDARLLRDAGALDVVAVTGSSLGFYTALAASGALSVEDVARLVDTVAALQREVGTGGQLITPLVDEHWRVDPARVAALENALAQVPGARRSVDLHSFAVLAGDLASLAALEAALPRVVQGGREYPMRLPQHLAFHTELLEPVAKGARERLQGHLTFRAPRTHLVLGNGAIASPWSCDAAALGQYTLGEQITTTFQLATAVRVALHELAPEVLVLTGPGESIGGAIGAVIAGEEWRGLASKEAFLARQKEDPVLLALGRLDQRARALGAVAPRA